MKFVQMGALVLAGALGTMLFTNLRQPSQPPAEAAPAVPAPSAPQPTPQPVTQPATPAPAPPVADLAPRSEPAPVRRLSRRAPAAPARSSEPAAVAQNPTPPPPPATQPVVEPPSQPAAPVTPPVAAPPPPPMKVTLRSGTLIPVRLIETVSSDRNHPGDTFTASLDQELVVDNFVIAERGARVEGKIVSTDQAGRVKGLARIGLELTSLTTSDGQRVEIQTDSFEKQGEESKGRDAAKIAGASAIGAAIGAIAGGGKGAAIGAGVGGAAGTGTVLGTRGKAAAISSETKISFRLREPVTVTEQKRR